MREAREKQNWERKDIARPADTCWFCGSATLQSLCPGRNTGPCKPGKPERYQMQTCDLGTHGCPGRGEKHACFVVRR